MDYERRLLQQIQDEAGERPVAEILRPGRAASPAETNQTILSTLPNPPTKATASGMVSTSRLTHKIPKAAKKVFDQAAKHIKKNRYAEAAALLEKAIVLDPEFADAHNDLGAQYMALGRVEEAEQSFRKAVALDTAFAVAHANLAVSEYLQGDLVNAEQEAHRALSFAPSNRSSLHLLELIQTKRGR